MIKNKEQAAASDDEAKQHYMSTILGQKTPYEILPDNNICDDDGIHLQLFRADSLWNVGKTAEAARLVAQLRQRSDWNEQQQYGAFARGLEALASGSLEQAYVEFIAASRQCNDRLESVFHIERAVNIAFWMACPKIMVEAGRLLSDQTETTPFAGGILAFAIHMSGDSSKAEHIARTAIQKGFDDPWTLHAVDHALYSQGRSVECAAWLREHRPQVQDCSAFMKGHMEFHLGLCLLDLNDARGVTELMDGPLWKSMSQEERKDYWNAAGHLNLLWKAELRGVNVAGEQHTRDALVILEQGDPAKSCVFSLCILRWTTGSVRQRWRDALFQSDNKVLVAVAKAVDAVYANGVEAEESSAAWKEAMHYVAPVAQQLEKLGASPEQREVIEEFVGVVGQRGDGGDDNEIDLASWDARNRRPNIGFYDTIFRRSLS